MEESHRSVRPARLIAEHLEAWIKLASLAGAVVVFGWGVFQYVQNEERQAERRLIEAKTPFLDRQLKLYTEATQVAATIATSDEAGDRDAATKRFWALYWGELALVEDRTVEGAMWQFGRALNEKVPREELQQRALDIARACRASLAQSWGVKDWLRVN